MRGAAGWEGVWKPLSAIWGSPPEYLESRHLNLDRAMGCDGQVSADQACPLSSNGSPVFLTDIQLLSANLLAFPEYFVLPLLFWLGHSLEPLPSRVPRPDSHRPPSNPHPAQVSNGYLAWSSPLPDVVEEQHPFLSVGGMGEGTRHLTSLRKGI